MKFSLRQNIFVNTQILKVSFSFLLIFVLSAWIFVTPAGSGIDDDFHLPSIWCGQGDSPDKCEMGKPNDLLGFVPNQVANAPFCIGHQPLESGACTEANNSENQLIGARINELGLYMPNGYYFVNSLFASEDLYSSIWLMRGLNLLIFFLLVLLVLNTESKRNKLLFGWLAIANLNPLFMSVLASNNNSSWFFASIIFIFYFIYTLLTSKNKKDIFISLASLLLILILALNSRSDTLGLILVMLIIANFAWLKGKWLVMYGFFLVSLGIFAWQRGSLPVVGGFGISSGFGSIDPRRVPSEVLSYNLINSYKLFNGLLGGWGINWLDFSTPQFAGLSLQLGLLLFIIFSFKKLNRTYVTGVIGIFTTMAIYLWIQQLDLNLIGEMIQPRYLYPILGFSLGFIIFSSNNLLTLSRSKTIAIASAYALGNAGIMHSTIRRFITGMDIRYWNLNEVVEWWPMPIQPMFFWIFWSFAIFFVVLLFNLYLKRVLS